MYDDSNAPRHVPRSAAARLGPLIREARQGLSQVEFAALANRPQSVISNLETGKRLPGLDLLAELEEALNLPSGTFAARAGYVSRDVFPLDPAQTLFSKEFETISEAVGAARAGEVLGLDVAVTSVVGNPRRWHVAVRTSDVTHHAS